MKLLLLILSITICTQTSQAQEVEYYNNQLLQKVIELPSLQEYFTLYEDKKNFLTILDNGAVDIEIPLSLYDKPVKFMSRQQLFSQKVYHQLEVNTIDINESTATVICLFPIEKLQINVYFKKEGQDDWRIDSSRIYQL